MKMVRLHIVLASIFACSVILSAGVTAPNGGEQICSRSTYTITWTVNPLHIPPTPLNKATIYFKRSSLPWTPWETIASNITNTGSWKWEVPFYTTDQTTCRIRVKTPEYDDVCDAVFTISGSSIRVTAPDSSQMVWPGEKLDIRWDSECTSGHVKIDLLVDGTTYPISSSTIDDGLLAWTVTDHPSSNCRIKVSDTEGGLSDLSDFFTINAPYIRVTAPEMFERLNPCETYEIRWESKGTSGNVKIDLYNEFEGISYPITASTKDDGVYSWTVFPYLISSFFYQIWVRDTDGEPLGRSETFTANTPYIRVTSPNGGEVFRYSQSYMVTWHSRGVCGNVRIEYKINPSSPWVTIVSSTEDDGSYLWTILNDTYSDQCKIRISELDGSPSDETDGIFQIIEATDTDKSILIDLYNSMDGAHWTRKDNWLSGNPLSTWYGITVDEGRVSAISLSSNRLNGDLPGSISMLTGLRVLHLSGNTITDIPDEIGTLSNLEELYLSNVGMTQFPIQITECTKLTHLELNRNQIGTLPPEIGNLSSLRVLYLSKNQLSDIPDEIGTLTNLDGLFLDDNDLSHIPECIANLSNLQALWLDRNPVGEFPSEFCILTKLTHLHLSGVGLTSIPDEIGNLSELYELVLSDNQLSTLPQQIGNLTHLNTLGLNNNLLTNLPETFGNLSGLFILSLDNNQLSALPGTLDDLTGLFSFSLVNNKLEFDDIEPFMDNAYSIFSYAPQDSAGETQYMEFEAGGRYDISVSVGGSDNHYQWLKSKIEIPGAIQPAYTIESATETDMGSYICRITNPLCPDLTLYTKAQHIAYLTDETDILFLTDLYNSTDGPHWSRSDNWLTDAPLSSWYGLTLEEGEITQIQLVSNGLKGTIPSSINSLDRLQSLDLTFNEITHIPDEIGDLSSLENINLSGNQIDEMPASIGNLSNLINLNFLGNKITEIPEQIGLLTNLETFGLGYCGLTSLPDEIGGLSGLVSLVITMTELASLPDEIGLLTKLERLELSVNRLTAIPAAVGNLSNLTHLSLYGNAITTLPPEIGNLSQLTRLYLMSNGISSFPAEMGNLTNLQTLSAGGNALSELPSEIFNLIHLTDLSLEQNHLTQLPDGIGNLVALKSLALFENQLSVLPDEIGNLSNLELLGVSKNRLINIPEGISNLIHLKYVDMRYNQLSQLPTSITDLNPEDFYVNYNRLTFEDFEPIMDMFSASRYYSPQDSVGEQRYLNYVEGLNYQLTAVVGGSENHYQWMKDGVDIPGAVAPDFTIAEAKEEDRGAYICRITSPLCPYLTLYTHTHHLRVFSDADYYALADLYNQTDGENWTRNDNWLTDQPLTEWYGISLTDGRVNTIYLRNNSLKGTVPGSIGNMDCLKEVSFGENALTGIPAEMGNLSQLEGLYLDNNQLTTIPEQIGNLTKLTQLSLYNNQISELPPTIGNLSNLVILSLSNNQLTGLPVGIGSLPNIRDLVLENNHLTSTSLPIEIGGLSSLGYLSLKKNLLTTIPKEIGALANLTSLELSDNQIVELPPEIGDLSSLVYLSVRSNQLTFLPSEIGQLTRLQNLDVSDNQLASIPEEIGDMSGLTLITLSNNQLTEIPSHIGNLKHVIDLVLTHNNLTEIPKELANIPLVDLLLAQNHLTSIPVEITRLSLFGCTINDNSLTFEDIEPFMDNPPEIFIYAPQGNVGPSEFIDIPPAKSFNISVAVGGSVNSYQWMKDDEEISGAILSTYSVSSASETDEGNYVCRITNSICPDLILYTNPKNIRINEEAQSMCTVVTPNGGEEWEIGSERVISWSSAATGGQVKIELSINDGGSWAQVEESTEDDGRYEWTVYGPASETCRIRITDVDGSASDISDGLFSVMGGSSVPQLISSRIPEKFILEKNYPNPFNAETNIQIGVPKFTSIDLTIYNVFGKKIKSLYSQKTQPGLYLLKWNGTDDRGDPVASGMYLIRLKADSYNCIHKTILIK